MPRSTQDFFAQRTPHWEALFFGVCPPALVHDPG